MRVTGDAYPPTVAVAPYFPKKGFSEVRIRNNVTQVSDEDRTVYTYDEYVFIVETVDGLQQKVEGNLDAWIATGRALETNENASIVQDMRTEIANSVSTGDLEAAYKEGVNSI